MNENGSSALGEGNIACNLCTKCINKKHERVLVGRKEFDVAGEIESLPFHVGCTSRYVCRGCVRQLKKRRSLINELDSIEKYFRSLASIPTSSPLKRGTTFEDATLQATKKICNVKTTSTSSPVRHAAPPSWPLSPIVFEQNKGIRVETVVGHEATNVARTTVTTDVFVRVNWPSKLVERKLPEDFESLGKMLVRGTYKQIAVAAWKNLKLRKEFEVLMAKEINKECSQLCSRKEPSCLRQTGKDSMLSFTMEKVSRELVERAPLFHSLLLAASVNPQSRAKTPHDDFPAVATPGAVCLHNRSKYLIAVQLLITIFLYHSSWLVSIFSYVGTNPKCIATDLINGIDKINPLSSMCLTLFSNFV